MTWQAERYAAAARAARPGVCRRCNAPVFHGLDADIAAFTVHVEYDPVTPAEELSSGKSSYDLVGRGQAATLWRRYPRHKQARPRFPIHLEHECQMPLRQEEIQL